MSEPPRRCTQCGTIAMFVYGGHGLCLSCMERLDAMNHAEFMRDAALYNKAAASVEGALGVSGVRVPKIDVPNYPIRTGPITMKNINVNNSVVGAINSGTIQRLVVSLRNIRLADAVASNQLDQLIKSIESEQSFSAEQRQQALELLSSIAEQLSREDTDRQPAVLHAVTRSLDRVLSVPDKLASIWSAFCATVGLAQFLG